MSGSTIFLRPNQTMEQTADRRTLHFRDHYDTFTLSAARSGPPSLMLLSLGGKRAMIANSPMDRDPAHPDQWIQPTAPLPSRVKVDLD